MEIVLKISFFVGAMLIGFGTGLMHIDKNKVHIGVGILIFGICLIGISAGII